MELIGYLASITMLYMIAEVLVLAYSKDMDNTFYGMFSIGLLEAFLIGDLLYRLSR